MKLDKHSHLYIPMYGVNIYIHPLTGGSEYVEEQSGFKDNGNKKEIQARTVATYGDDGFRLFILIDDLDHTKITHEIIHAIFYLMETKDTYMNHDSSQEPFAYLAEYLHKAVIDTFAGKTKDPNLKIYRINKNDNICRKRRNNSHKA